MRDPIHTAEIIEAQGDELRARSSALIAEGSLCLAECIRELELGGVASAPEHQLEAERHFDAAYADEYGAARDPVLAQGEPRRTEITALRG